MKLSDYPVYPRSRVSYYADRVIRELNLKEPPIIVEPILEYFGIDLQWIDSQAEFDFERKRIQVENPHSCRRKGQVDYIRENDKYERRRLSVFHECGHFDIPRMENILSLCAAKIH
jgi:hypothetical protein